jgi:hypothetical protein
MAAIAELRRTIALIVMVLAACGAAGIVVAQVATDASSPAAGAWTLEEARAHLRLFPRDAYVQYVALQLARREGKLDEIAAEIGERNPQWRDQRAMRRGQVDLFSIFSGQLAVQESLQLDALAPEQEGSEQPVAASGRRRRRSGPLPLAGASAEAARKLAADTVAVTELTGPTVESHPWKTMLAGRTPEVTGLALSTPADFYFVSFRSVNKLLDAADVATLWGAHVFNQSNREAQTQLVGDRLREQLCVEATPELRPFYDAVVDEAAIVGSDLFLREGSDVTMLFHVKQPAVFRAKMDQFLAAAANSRDDATRRKDRQIFGISYEEVATPDRRIHVYSAYPRPDLHVRSNSRAALERVLAAVVGPQQGIRPVERLGETDEFRYVRTLLPPGAPEEDGLVYLSDPFVRRMMSPALRLTERRRMVCYNNLRMIGHAGLMYRTQTGKAADSLAELAAAGCAPGEFGKGKFACPEHGEYTLAADGLTGVCSHHGYASYLTPCDEIETTHVTEAEATAYRQFVTEYNQYWRQFFDPIAIRLQITPERYRAETIVLPLIDNSIYTSLAQSLGGEPEPLDALPVPKRNIFSFAVRLNKAAMLHGMGLDHLIAESDPQRENLQAKTEAARTAGAMRQMLVAMHNYESAHRQFPAAAKNGLSWRVHILPYLEQEALYREFHLDEPWDSPHNRELIKRMPEIYQPSIDKLRRAGKTKYVVPRGEGTMFGDGAKGAALQDFSDGTSNTIALVECDDEHAVEWTKPDDIEIAPRDARRDLQWRESNVFLVATADGSVQALRSNIEPGILAGMLTPAGGETGDWRQFASAPPEFRQPRGYRDRHAETLESLGIGELVTKGVGNQLGFHVYDAEPMFDLGLTRFMGMTMGSLRGSRGIDNDFLYLFPLVGALNGPVYVSIPVKDREVVDAFLDRLDGYLAELSVREQRGWFFSVDQDFYHLPDVDGRQVRAYGFGFGPLKWRFFWSRIDDALYIASKREVLDDLAALAAEGPATDPGPAAHALVRLRPQHWDQVLGAYRLGWEENNREACLKNLGPLGGISRALASNNAGGEPITASDLELYAARVYDVHHFCPDGGNYEIAADGRSVSCSTHGTMGEPRQTEAPAEASELGKLLKQFSDMTITLTFLEDGLHAVATLEREPPSDK